MEKERKVGEVFDLGDGSIAICKITNTHIGCAQCVYGGTDCIGINCMPNHRKDRHHVCFPLASIEEISSFNQRKCTVDMANSNDIIISFTKQEIESFKQRMVKFTKYSDTEIAHSDADYLLIEILSKSDNFKEIIELYKSIDKQYA